MQYFTYWQFPGLGDSKDVPVTNAGERGSVWWLVRDLNREIQSLAPVFLEAEVVDVSHTGDQVYPKRRLKKLGRSCLTTNKVIDFERRCRAFGVAFAQR